MPSIARWTTLALVLLSLGCHKQPYEAPRVTATEAHALQAKGEPLVIVDVRSASAFAREHVAGAIDMPYATMRAQPAKLPKNRTLLFYCT